MNNTMTVVPKTLVDILELLEIHDGEAIVAHNGYRTFRYNYRDLCTYIKKASSWYVSKGIRKGDTILLWGPNSIEWVVASLGAVAIGAVVVPIDLQATSTSAKGIAIRSGARLMLQSRYRPQRTAVVTHTLENFLYEIESLSAIEASHLHEDDLAYIVYTSGTTGDPKGVMLTHGNVTANALSAIEHFTFEEKVRVLSTLPLSHMFEQIGGLWVPLILGGTIVYPSAILASALFEMLKRERVTHMLVVPRLIEAMYAGVLVKAKEAGSYDTLMRLVAKADTWPLFVKKIVFRKLHKVFGTHFEYMVSGGAPLSKKVAEFWRRVGIVIYEGYGLTETSPVISATSPSNQAWGTVGKEFPKVSVRFSKDREIEVQGPNVFKGYYHNEQATHEAFTADNWFKTGDIGYKDKDGNIIISGRVKEMILSSSGINVFPDDIERVLLEDERVKEACVVGVLREHGEAIHAVLILKDGSVDTKDTLREIVQRANDNLSSSMRIQGYSLWHEKEFPKTTTLKTKRTLVQKVVNAAQNAPTDSGNRVGKLYELLAIITGRNALLIQKAHTLVSDVGLDSLGRVELIASIAREYNYELSEEMITARTTVGELEEYIQERKKSAQQKSEPRIMHTFFGRMIRLLLSYVESAISACFITLKVIGGYHALYHRGPVIFVTNHVSSADHSVIVRALPFRYRYLLASPTADTYYHRPHAKFFERILYKGILVLVRFGAGAFLMRQQDGFSASLKHAGYVVDTGESLLMFPEGKRGDEIELHPFMKGTAHLIRALKVPVIPIAHNGLSYILKKKSIFPRPGMVSVVIGKPIFFTTESDDEIMATLRRQITELHTEAVEKNPYRAIYQTHQNKK